MSNKKDRFLKRKRSGMEQTVIIGLTALIIVLLLAIGCVANDFLARGMDAVSSEPALQTSPETLPLGTGVTEEATPSMPEETKVDVYMQLPMLLEDGKLELESLFQYTGLNPDAGWADATNAGGAVLINRSGEYLASMELSISLSDGTDLIFEIHDLAPGAVIWAYDLHSTKFDSNTAIFNVQYNVEFLENTGLTEQEVTVDVDGMNVTITNLSTETLENLEIHCHSLLEGICLGGVSYTYPIEFIGPGETVIIQAIDCVFGQTAVMCVDYAK